MGLIRFAAYCAVGAAVGIAVQEVYNHYKAKRG